MNRFTYKLVVMLALLVMVAGCAANGSGAVAAKNELADTLTVMGYGEARGNPDMATVSVGVNMSNVDISTAVESSNATIADITTAMQDLGIAASDIQTTGFNVWPEDVWDPNTGQQTGEKRFHVDSTMQINIRTIGDVGKVLETALTNGANSIYGLSFGMQETGALADEARTAAVANARERAQKMADELGLTLGEVSSASDQSGGTVYPYFVGAAMGMGGGGGEPPISQGQMAVSVSVSVTYAIVR